MGAASDAVAACGASIAVSLAIAEFALADVRAATAKKMLLVGAAYQRGVVRRDCIVAAITFAIFGASDLVEATTGAWWRPWWLLLWKAACLFAFLVLLVRYVRRRSQRQDPR